MKKFLVFFLLLSVLVLFGCTQKYGNFDMQLLYSLNEVKNGGTTFFESSIEGNSEIKGNLFEKYTGLAPESIIFAKRDENRLKDLNLGIIDGYSYMEMQSETGNQVWVTVTCITKENETIDLNKFSYQKGLCLENQKVRPCCAVIVKFGSSKFHGD